MSITVTCPLCERVLDHVNDLHAAYNRAPMYAHECRFCPVCSSGTRKLIHQVPGIDQRVYLCSDCGMIYSESKPFDYSETSIYAEYEMPEFRDHSEQVARRIDQMFPNRETRIIDIGCATGTLLKALREIGYQNLEGCDPNAGAIARLDGIRGHVGGLGRAWQADLAVLSHVVEHVPQPLAGLQALDVSHLYIEVPDASRYLSACEGIGRGFNTEHVNHFTPDTLVRLGQRAGFALENLGVGNYEYHCGRGRIYPVPVIWATFRKRRVDLTGYIEWLKQDWQKLEQKLEQELESGGQLVIWGLGQTTSQIMALPILQSQQVIAAVDSNPVFHGRPFRGVLAVAPAMLREIDPGVPLLIASYNAAEQIQAAARAMSLRNRMVTLL